MLIFGFDKGISLAKSSKNLFLAGTFKIVPQFFQNKGKLLTLRILDPASNIFIPVVHILMQSRTAEAYLQAFCESLPIIDFINFEIVTIDFELALFKSMKVICQESKVTGCLFHYRQALIRKMKELYPKQNVPDEVLSLYGTHFLRY